MTSPTDPRIVALQTALAQRYEFLSLLGEGGFANVYEVRNLQLGRIEAMKVHLHSPGGKDAAEFSLRFEMEARIVASLDHPHIVKLFDFGTTEGIAWFSMQYVQGASLADRIDNHAPMPESRAVEILLPVLDALEYAHQRGIVHRDIKPGNILFDAEGRPFVADFGLAKPKDSASVTRTNVVMGTPHYLAPEQARGKVLDHRSDIYALTVTLYEMLTASRPFASSEGMEAVIAKLTLDPEPARVLRPDLSLALEGVLSRGLARSPEARFQSAREMAAALKRALEFPNESVVTGTETESTPGSPSGVLTERPLSIAAKTPQDTFRTEVLVEAGRAEGRSPATPRITVGNQESVPGAVEAKAKRPWLALAGLGTGLVAITLFLLLRGPAARTQPRPAVSSQTPPATPAPQVQAAPTPFPTLTEPLATRVVAVDATPISRERPREVAALAPKLPPRPVVPPIQTSDGDPAALAGMPSDCAGVQVLASLVVDASGQVKSARPLSKESSACWATAEKFLRSLRFEPARGADGTAVESAPLAVSVTLGEKKP